MQCTDIVVHLTAVQCSEIVGGGSAWVGGYDRGTVGIRRILGSILASVRHLLRIRSGSSANWHFFRQKLKREVQGERQDGQTLEKEKVSMSQERELDWHLAV